MNIISPSVPTSFPQKILFEDWSMSSCNENLPTPGSLIFIFETIKFAGKQFFQNDSQVSWNEIQTGLRMLAFCRVHTSGAQGPLEAEQTMHLCSRWLLLHDSTNTGTWTWGVRNVNAAEMTQEPHRLRIRFFPTFNTRLDSHPSFLEQIVTFKGARLACGKLSPLQLVGI